MLDVAYTKTFRKGYKKSIKRNKNMIKLDEVISQLRAGAELPEKYKDHALIGNYNGKRECHLEPDWLLVYQIAEDTLILEKLGTHSDLF